MVYIWLLVIAASVLVEASTSALIAIWFAPSALVCAILAATGVPLYIQGILFITLSCAFMLFFYQKLKDNIQKKSEKTNLDAIIGKSAVVEEDFSNLKVGRVKVGGISWSAVCDSDESFSKGDIVIIKEISGVKLICARQAPTDAKTYTFTN